MGERQDVSYFALDGFWIHELRETFAAHLWKNNATDAYRSAARSLADAYTRFFFKQSGHPRFKRKGGTESYTEGRARLSIDADSIQLTRVGWVRLHERLKAAAWLIKCGATLQAVTVSREPTGRYHASLRLRVPSALMAHFLKGKFSRKGSGFVGVDLGLKKFATTSDGLVVPNPRYLRKLEAKLSKAQQAKARKYEARKKSDWAYPKSNSEHAAQLKVNRVYRKVKNQRQEFLIRTARQLVEKNTTVVIEDLNVKGMLANRYLAKSVSDASWSKFTRWLTHFSKQYGTEVIKVDRFYPSSKICSSCGAAKAKLSLGDRTYECEQCGVSIDRDLKAALNLRAEGLEIVAARCAETVNGGEPSAVQSKEPCKTRSKASQGDQVPQEQPS